MCRVAALLCVLGLALVVDPTLCRGRSGWVGEGGLVAS